MQAKLDKNVTSLSQLSINYYRHRVKMNVHQTVKTSKSRLITKQEAPCKTSDFKHCRSLAMHWRVALFSVRVSDSPIDLKLDLFNPAIKRLHIDIPARPIQLPPVPGPAAPAFDQHGAFSSRPDDASTSSSTARDLSVDRNGPSTASSSLTAPAIGQSFIYS